MEKEQQDLLKKINTGLEGLKKSQLYLSSLQADVAKNGFMLIDQKSYTNVLRENAVKKSHFVALLSEHKNVSEVSIDPIELWENNSSLSQKNTMYDLVKTHTFTITPEEQKALQHKDVPIIPHGFTIVNPVFEINSSYDNKKALSLEQHFSKSLALEGEKHLIIQKKAQEFINNMTSSWDKKQELFKTLSQTFSDKYDAVWTEFKTSAKHHDVNASLDENGHVSHFSISSKLFGKEQKIQFHVTDLNHIAQISFVPELKNTIQGLRDKMTHDHSLDNKTILKN